MKRLPLEDYQRLSEGAELLEQDGYGPKVLLTPQGRIIKLFRRKRFFSRATLYSYARRFRRNAQRLNRYGVPSVQVEQLYRCPAISRDLVVYPRLPGTTLRRYAAEAPQGIEQLGELARFIALLHHKGIYFRSLHLGNVLIRPDSSLALIDVADLEFKWLPMGPLARVRNFRHMLRYPQDLSLLRRFGLKRFLRIYLLTSGISPWSAKIMLSRLARKRGSAPRRTA
jgi:hypothetical protein